MVALGTRIYTTVLVAFAWFAFVLAFISFEGESFSLDQDLAILLASGLLAAGTIGGLWLYWTLRRRGHGEA